MHVVILAGGKGTRLSEETQVRPKPMVEIGGKPIIWHIMKSYASHGFSDFVVACGYKGEMIKEYFCNFVIHNSDYLIDLKTGHRQTIHSNGIDWKIRVVDSGTETMTGGRLLRVKSLLGDQPFMVTYGDGLGDVNIRRLVDFHKSHGRIATVTAVHPPARFGALNLKGDKVQEFSEKPQTGEAWINGGFFVFEPAIFDLLRNDNEILERSPLEALAARGELMAYRHDGFWQPMDTLREKHLLESYWQSGNAPWKVWA